jgi:catechol 2,3-dioxygenase-like lactoylglutathione lyase family enzyme
LHYFNNKLKEMKPEIDHIQITVKDLNVAEKFYDKFLPVIGFDITKKVTAFIREHDFHVIEYTHELLAFAITPPREAFKNDIVNRRKPGALHHLAFRADSWQEVDRAYDELVKMGANIVSEPKIHPEYSRNYYAVYFKDMENIKYEIVCTKESEY